MAVRGLVKVLEKIFLLTTTTFKNELRIVLGPLVKVLEKTFF